MAIEVCMGNYSEGGGQGRGGRGEGGEGRVTVLVGKFYMQHLRIMAGS